MNKLSAFKWLTRISPKKHIFYNFGIIYCSSTFIPTFENIHALVGNAQMAFIPSVLDVVLLGAIYPALFQGSLWLLSSHLLAQYSRRLSRTIRPLEKRSLSLVEAIFAGTLTISLHLFFLLCLEIIGWFDKSIRWLFWTADMTMLNFTLVAVIPLLMIKSVVVGSGLVNAQKGSFVLIIFSIYLFIFSRLGRSFDLLHTHDHQSVSMFTLDYWACRIGIVGVSLMALLSGYAAAEKPLRTFVLRRRHTASILPVAESENRLFAISNEIESKKERLNRLSEEAARSSSTRYQNMGIFHRVYESMSAALDTSETDTLMMEIAALEATYAQATVDFDEARAYRGWEERASTFCGMCAMYSDQYLAIYCIYRIGIAIFNSLFYRMASSDPVSLFAGFMLHYLNVQLDTAFWSMIFTLWTIGMLVFSSITNFLNSLMRTLTSVSPFDSAEVSIYSMAYIAGIYLTSTMLTLKNSLKSDYGSIISEFLPLVKFDFFAKWFDFIFVVASIGSGAVIYLQHR